MIIQLGISLMVPVFMCIGFCYWLCSSFGAPEWIYIPGILFGLGASVMSAYKFYLGVMKQEKRFSSVFKGKKKTVSFNDHI